MGGAKRTRINTIEAPPGHPVKAQISMIRFQVLVPRELCQAELLAKLIKSRIFGSSITSDEAPGCYKSILDPQNKWMTLKAHRRILNPGAGLEVKTVETLHERFDEIKVCDIQ